MKILKLPLVNGRYKPIFVIGLFLLTFFMTWQLVGGSQKAVAASCAIPPTNYGTDTMTVSTSVATTYTLWVRMMVPDTTNTAINAQVDASTCFNVGGGTNIPANTWTWVNYQNGVTGTPDRVSLSAGSHTVELIGTNPGVEVDRVILTSDTTCTPTGTGDNCATGNNNPPAVSLTAPTTGSTVTGTVTLSATATDPSGISSVSFLVNGTVVDTETTSPYSFNWNSTSVANGTYSIVAQAIDGAGVSGSSSNVSVTVSNTVSCSVPPSVPGTLQVTGTTMTTIALSWSASTPGAGCTMSGYKVFRGATLLGTIASGTSYTDTGLIPSTSYSYTVEATDTSGHTSAPSSSANGTTAADTSAPTTPTGLQTSVITSSSIALSWTASTDNVGVTGYRIYRNGTQVGTSVTTTYTDTGLSPSTPYIYTVKAYDAANNLSTASSSLNATTLSGTSVTGDLDGNGKVNLTDLSILLSHWGLSSGATASQGDLDGNGKVNLTDLSILLSHWSP